MFSTLLALPNVAIIITKLNKNLKSKSMILLSLINKVRTLITPIKEPKSILIGGVFLFKRTEVAASIKKSYTKLIRIIKSI